MRLIACCTLVLSFLFQCSCNSTLQIKLEEKLSENINRNNVECLKTFIDVTASTISEFQIIIDDINIVDDNLFTRYPNCRWKVDSVRNVTFAGLSNTIIFAHDFESLDASFTTLNIKRMDNRSKYVISVAKNYETLDEIKKASRKNPSLMWESDKTNVVYLVPCKEDILVMTYFPFARNCQVGELEVLDVWRERRFENGTEFFPGKMFDIRGCVQNYSVIYQNDVGIQTQKEFTEEGDLLVGTVGGSLMAFVAKKMNMKMKLLPDEADSWDSLIQQISRGETLLSVSTIIPTPVRAKYLDVDTTYTQDSYCFGYETGGKAVSWKNLVHPLSGEVWSYIGYILLLFLGLLLVANHCRRGETRSHQLRILDGIGILIGTSRALPLNGFSRYLFAIWTFYSYLINVTYNSVLVSFLTTPNDKLIINTLEELLAEDIIFGGAEFHRQFYNDSSDPVMMKIYNNFKLWPLSEGVKRVQQKQATGVLTSSIHAYNSIHGKNGSTLRALKDKALSFHVPIALRKGSPFAIGMHRYAFQAIQSGFHHYWINYRSRGTRTKGNEAKTPTIISTHHLRGALCIYMVGSIISVLALLGEIIYHKRLSRL